MQIKNEYFTFTLDSLTPESCSGWYIRNDDLDTAIIIKIGSESAVVFPDSDRPDMIAGGYGIAKCGFSHEFGAAAGAGEDIIFSSSDGKEIYRYKLPGTKPASAGLNERLMDMVEPFVEMDIAKIRKNLELDQIFNQYRRKYAASLEAKRGNELLWEIADILADIKTTVHLLSAAYLDNARYKEPAFLTSLPDLYTEETCGFAIEMAGDITGNDWGEAQDNGRWTGNGAQSSIILPNPGAGSWNLEVYVEDANPYGAIEAFDIYVNNEKMDTTRKGAGIPYSLIGAFKIDDASFLAVHFHKKDDRHDHGNPSLLIKKLAFIRSGE